MKPFLYLTHDGVLDHIGQSQILPYLKVYSKHTKVFLISFEKSHNIKQASKLKKSKECKNINWIILKYHKNIIMKIFDCLILFSRTIIILKKNKLSLIHCRSYLPTLIVYCISFFIKIKYIFDIRDFWADEGIEIKKYKFIYKIIKKFEGSFINKSSHIVCLTSAAKNHINNNYKVDFNKISVIPCGTDFNLFNKNRLKKNFLKKIHRDLKLKNKKILLYYGSLGENYLTSKMISFFKYLKFDYDEWIFMFLVNNDQDYLENKLKEHLLQKKNYIIINSSRDNLPYYLYFADLSVFFYRSGMRSLGCSPTKLADLFAMDIPIITSSNLGDMKKIISLNKNNSILLDSLSKSSVASAVKSIMSNKSSIKIRKNSGYYNYKYGTEKYIRIYQALSI